MNVTDEELRALARESIARVRAAPPVETFAPDRHASHLRLPLARGDDGDGACLIEPSVRCTHCGYCQSLGH